MIYIYVDTLKANNKQFGMSLRVGSFQGALRFRPSFIVTGSFPRRLTCSSCFTVKVTIKLNS
jgi:hypothetical protein